MEKEERAKIKKVFFDYPKIMRESVHSTVEWAENNMAVNYSKVSVQTSPSNYKETQLCALLDDNLKKMRWCYVVEKVIDHFKFEQPKVNYIQKHYFEKKGEVQTCLILSISMKTFYRWQNEIIDIAYKWAKELKVL